MTYSHRRVQDAVHFKSFKVKCKLNKMVLSIIKGLFSVDGKVPWLQIIIAVALGAVAALAYARYARPKFVTGGVEQVENMRSVPKETRKIKQAVPTQMYESPVQKPLPLSDDEEDEYDEYGEYDEDDDEETVPQSLGATV